MSLHKVETAMIFYLLRLNEESIKTNLIYVNVPVKDSSDERGRKSIFPGSGLFRRPLLTKTPVALYRKQFSQVVSVGSGLWG